MAIVGAVVYMAGMLLLDLDGMSIRGRFGIVLVFASHLIWSHH